MVKKIKDTSLNRINIPAGTIWEDVVGYSRAVKVGNIIEVSGTTSVDNGKIIGKGNAYEQTKFILEKIKNTLEALGSGMNEVIRTRIYVTDISKWEEIGKAHGEFFKNIKPATAMVEVKSLIDHDMIVEIEATAVLNK
ncbi:MAG: RidA family protein [Ignavibacteriales bacterium]|nr:MAG: RidA family protein [Ignavibacteriales bacterium]